MISSASYSHIEANAAGLASRSAFLLRPRRQTQGRRRKRAKHLRSGAFRRCLRRGRLRSELVLLCGSYLRGFTNALNDSPHFPHSLKRALRIPKRARTFPGFRQVGPFRLLRQFPNSHTWRRYGWLFSRRRAKAWDANPVDL